MPSGLAETTTFFSPMQRTGTSSSFSTLTPSQVSFRIALPMLGSSMASVSVFQVPMSFHWPAKRMTWILDSFSTTA